MRLSWGVVGVVAGCVALGCVAVRAQSGPLGVFESQSDVGSVTPAGTGAFDAGSGAYTLTSSGANLWMRTDAFHFVWKKISGDAVLTADAALGPVGPKSSPHRKVLLMFRQSLDEDAMYADAAVHGSGETALQFRSAKADTTQDITVGMVAPKRMRLEKRGDVVTLFVADGDGPLGGSWKQAGASIRMHFDGDFYAGIGVCAHDKDLVEKGVFTNVELKPLEAGAASGKMTLYSTLQTISINPDARRDFVVITTHGSMEAPNWSRDGKSLLFTREGKLWTVPVEDGAGKGTDLSQAREMDLGGLTNCSGSHGFSPDGKLLAATCEMTGKPGRRVYVVPVAGGAAPRMLTETPNSYFHSWSPDGKTIAFTRPGKGGGGNIYAIPVEGGQETALTTGTGISDDPDYTPDGKWIYFNSDRAGGMQIFRMKPDGSGVEQVTSDERRNWTPHPSPDGKSVLIIAYEKDVNGHPANKPVTLRILDVATGKMRDLIGIVGGSGSDNVANWAPDGEHFAFVSYQMLPE